MKQCTYSGIYVTFLIGGQHPHYDVTGGGANDRSVGSELHINMCRNKTGGSTDCTSFNEGTMTTYKVTVSTGEQKCAETMNSIYLTLLDSEKQSSGRTLVNKDVLSPLKTVRTLKT